MTADEWAELSCLISTGKAAARKLAHARILLLADDNGRAGHADEAIVQALGSSRLTVARVRKQFVTKGLDAALNRRRQSPRPDKIKIKDDLEQRLITLACSDPPAGRCH